MTTFLIILGVVVYLIIGGVFMAIVDDEDIFGLCVLWPVFLVLIFFVGIGWGAKEIGYLIVNSVKRKISEYLKGEEQ